MEMYDIYVIFGCFVGLLITFILFFAFSDSTLNLCICKAFGISEDKYFTGKVIWVIGASSGIGESIVKRLAHHPCRLIISARRHENLQQIARSCIEVGIARIEHICILPIDITKFETLQEKVQYANSYFQHHVDIIVLCSGQSQRAEWTEVDPSVDEQCFRINALGPTVLARFAVNYFQQHSLKAHFIVISSICGLIPAPLSPSYTAAKHALMGYFRLLNLEYSTRGIVVTIVCPSLTFSPNNVFNAFTSKLGKFNEQVIERISPKHMSCERAAELILIAGANQLSEASLSQTWPPLLLTYLFTICPDLTFRLIHAIGPDRIRQLRTGVD